MSCASRVVVCFLGVVSARCGVCVSPFAEIQLPNIGCGLPACLGLSSKIVVPQMVKAAALDPWEEGLVIGELGVEGLSDAQEPTYFFWHDVYSLGPHGFHGLVVFDLEKLQRRR